MIIDVEPRGSCLRDPRRLAALRHVNLLDTPTEASFDRLARLASNLLETPVALITLVDADRQFFKACHGLRDPWATWRETPLSHSICQHVVESGAPLIIEDTRAHALLKDNLAVTELGVAAYLGVPLAVSSGETIGSLCVLDSRPRQWSADAAEVMKDLAASVMTEIELRGSERRYRSLFERALDAILVIDENGRYVDVNPAACQMTGYTRDELLGQSARRVTPPENHRTNEALFQELRSGGGLQGECQLVRKDGTIIAAEYRASKVGANCFQAIFRDVTERRRIEAALSQSEECFRVLFHDHPHPMCVYDVESLRMLQVNDAALTGSGYARAEFLELNLSDFFVGDDRTRILDLVLRTERPASVRVTGPWRMRRKNGTTFVAELASHSTTYAGRPAVVVVAFDITERQKAQQEAAESSAQLQTALLELQETQRQVIQQERLSALGQMASGIAHDFNNALAQVLGYVELLLEVRPGDLADPAKVRSHLSLVRTAAEDAADVVRRLREFYRLRQESEVFLPTDLNQVVEQAVNLTRPCWRDQALASGSAIRVTTSLTANRSILANQSELREVLTNLIFNAVAAMPEGGDIAIRTRCEANAVVLEIEDTGIGMTEEVRQRCMEPFFTTKGTYGSGLGLAMVYGVVHRHDGTVDVASEPGRGTTFTIRFPMKAAPECPVRHDGASVAIGPRRILVVDDEPALRQIIAGYLQADGHTVETAANGHDGLRAYLAGYFDLIITDRAMPEMNGDALARAIKERAPDKPVLMLTGFGELIEAQNEVIADVDAIAAKPISPDSLRRAIAPLLATREASARRPVGDEGFEPPTTPM